MATVLYTGYWGSGPKIPVEFRYDKSRSGSNMIYRVYVEIKPLTSGYFGYGIRVSANVGGQTVQQTVKNASPSQWSSSYIFDSGNITIANKTSGTTPLTITLTGIDAPRGSQSYQYNLPIDPAMSEVSATNAFADNTSTITIHKANNSFTHTLKYSIANGTQTTLVTKTSSSTYTWTLPSAECYSAMGSSGKTTYATIYCITYDGNTEIGTTTCNIVITARENALKPAVGITVSPVNPRSDLTGSADTIINNYGGAVIVGTATPKGGATIRTHIIQNGNNKYANSALTLTNLSSNQFSYTATDSRGFSNSVSTTKTVIWYTSPRVSISTPIISTSGVATFKARGTWFNDSFGSVNNTLSLAFGYKVEGANSFTWTTTQSITSSGNDFSKNASISGLDYTKQYVFVAYVWDELYSVYSNEMSARALPVFDWGKDDFQFNVRVFSEKNINFGTDDGTAGNQTGERSLRFRTTGTNPHNSYLYGGNPSSAVAIGLYDQNNSRNILQYQDANNRIYIGGSDTNVRVHQKTLAHFIVESGTDSNTGWYYRKYSDNTVELYGTFDFTNVDGNKNHYSGFYYSDPIVVNYPFTLQSVISGSITGGSTDRINFLKPVQFETGRMSYWVCTNNIIGTTTISGKAYISVIGTY